MQSILLPDIPTVKTLIYSKNYKLKQGNNYYKRQMVVT